MLLARLLESQGGFLFRWRGLLPYLLIPFAIIALVESGSVLEQALGGTVEDFLDTMGIAVALAGVLLRVLTVGFVPSGTSGRNTRKQRADQLNTTGIYSIVRNPLYLGNFLVLLGFAIDIQVWWFVLLTCLGFALYYERIVLKEEAYLQETFGSAYASWAEVTPAFLPDPSRWILPALPFSFRTVLRREFTGFYIVAVGFTFIELGHAVAEDGLTTEIWQSESDTLIFFATSTAIYVVLRFLKKRTNLLRARGR